MTIYGPRKGVPVTGYRNKAHRRKGVHYGAGLNLAINRPRHHGYDAKVPAGAYSDHGLRVEAALCALEAVVKRMEARL